MGTIIRRRLRNVYRTTSFASAAHPYRMEGLRLFGLEDFSFSEHPYRSLTGIKSLISSFIEPLIRQRTMLLTLA
jgi:hypothetical protein